MSDKSNRLMRLGFSREDSEMALTVLGENAGINDLGHFIATLQLRRIFREAGFVERNTGEG